MRVVLQDDTENSASGSGLSRNGRTRVLIDNSPDDDILKARSTRNNNRVRAHKPRRVTNIIPKSRSHMLWELDERTKEAQLMRHVRAELIEHIGGNPSITERLLIERAVMLSLKVAQIDARILSGEVFNQHDTTHALAWNNAFRRTLVDLGLEPRNAPEPKFGNLNDWVNDVSSTRKYNHPVNRRHRVPV